MPTPQLRPGVPGWYSLAEVGRILTLSKRSVFWLVSSGRLSTVQTKLPGVRTRRFVLRTELLRFINASGLPADTLRLALQPGEGDLVVVGPDLPPASGRYSARTIAAGRNVSVVQMPSLVAALFHMFDRPAWGLVVDAGHVGWRAAVEVADRMKERLDFPWLCAVIDDDHDVRAFGSYDLVLHRSQVKTMWRHAAQARESAGWYDPVRPGSDRKIKGTGWRRNKGTQSRD